MTPNHRTHDDASGVKPFQLEPAMRSQSLLVLLVSFLLFTPASRAAEPDPNFYIFLCLGQSNMEGFPGVEQQYKTVDPRFKVLAAVDVSALNRNKGNWYDAIPPLC